MTIKTITTTIEILGKPYSIRCPEPELQSLHEAAEFLNQHMKEIQDSGKALLPERIAIIVALNMTHQFLQLNQQKNSFTHKIQQRIADLQNKLDIAINQSMQAELIYSAE